MATDRWERSGLKIENVGPTFLILTVLLGGKSLIKSLIMVCSHLIDCAYAFLSFKGFFVDQ